MSPWILTAVSLLAEGQEAPPPPSPLGNMLVPLGIAAVLFYFMIIRPQRAKERDFRTLVDNLKKNDHVVTVGGIHGTVTSVNKDLDRVVVRIDDNNGTTIRVSTGSIGRVVTDEDVENPTSGGK